MTSIKDPLLLKTFVVNLVVIGISLALQMNWLRKQP